MIFRDRSYAEFSHQCILITLTKDKQMSLYDQVRYAWRIDPEKAKDYPYVMAVRDGVIIGIYKVDEWKAATVENFPEFNKEDREGRYGFEGYTVGNPELRKQYIGKYVPERYRGQNPVRYVDTYFANLPHTTKSRFNSYPNYPAPEDVAVAENGENNLDLFCDVMADYLYSSYLEEDIIELSMYAIEKGYEEIRYGRHRHHFGRRSHLLNQDEYWEIQCEVDSEHGRYYDGDDNEDIGYLVNTALIQSNVLDKIFDEDVCDAIRYINTEVDPYTYISDMAENSDWMLDDYDEREFLEDKLGDEAEEYPNHLIPYSSRIRYCVENILDKTLKLLVTDLFERYKVIWIVEGLYELEHITLSEIVEVIDRHIQIIYEGNDWHCDSPTEAVDEIADYELEKFKVNINGLYYLVKNHIKYTVRTNYHECDLAESLLTGVRATKEQMLDFKTYGEYEQRLIYLKGLIETRITLDKKNDIESKLKK